MRIAVYGSGAVGGYFGGRLAEAGTEVTFIARGEHLRAMRRSGLRIDSPKGDMRIVPAQATENASEVGVVDLVLLGVKAWQVPSVAPLIRPLLGADSAVLPLGNGVEATDQLSDALGSEHVLGGLCTIISKVEAPGHIRHLGAEPTIVFGELDDRRSERAQAILRTLEAAGVTSSIAPDIQGSMWEKFLFIASVSGVGAVGRVPLGVLRNLPETRALLLQAMQEVAEVARARGVGVRDDAVERAMGFLDALPDGGTASMQRDIMDGRPSELESQTGAVVRLGSEAGVATPVHSTLYAALLPMERLAREE